MNKQELHALLQQSGLFNRMQQAGIEKLSIETDKKATGNASFNILSSHKFHASAKP